MLSQALRRALTTVVATCVLGTALVACGGHSSGAKGMGGMDMNGMNGMNGMDMPDMTTPTGPKIAAAAPSDTGLHSALGGYSYVVDATAPFTFHIVGPAGKAVTRFQPYEAQLVEFYLVRDDLGDFRQLMPSMRADGTWTVPIPALPAGSYRTFITFAAPDSSAGTPLSYSLSQPLTIPGAATVKALPAAADTAATDGYTLRLTGSPHRGAETDFGVVVTKDGKPVQQFDRFLDGYAHLTAFRSGDTAFARALSTGRSAGGASGAGALTAQILFPESGSWRLFVQFRTSGVEHVAAFTVEVP
jgi:hypothetical protein